jgi:ribosomal protein S18 acetylase RimI-like enzyme
MQEVGSGKYEKWLQGSPLSARLTAMKDGAPEGVRALERGETEQLVALYQRSFWDDPAIEFLLPNEKRRAKGLDAYMRMAIRYGLKHGRVQTIAGDAGPRVGSVWLPPGEALATFPKLIRAGFIGMIMSNLNAASLRKFFAMSSMIEEHRKADIQKNHWYLWILAADVTEQGQGLGTAVLEEELREADLAGVPCYVETAKQINLEFYEKQGFVTKREDPLPGGGPPLWTMIRKPMG